MTVAAGSRPVILINPRLKVGLLFKFIKISLERFLLVHPTFCVWRTINGCGNSIIFHTQMPSGNIAKSGIYMKCEHGLNFIQFMVNITCFQTCKNYPFHPKNCPAKETSHVDQISKDLVFDFASLFLLAIGK